MNPTNWKYSQEVIEAGAFVKPEPGVQTVKVLDAMYDENTQKYDIDVWSSLNEAKFKLRYNMSKITPDGKIAPNQSTYRTLNSLAKAIYGVEGARACTIPNPVDVVGTCVVVDVKLNDYVKTVPEVDANNLPILNEDGTTKMKDIKRVYANVYEFFPCSAEDLVAYSDRPDQYHLD